MTEAELAGVLHLTREDVMAKAAMGANTAATLVACASSRLAAAPAFALLAPTVAELIVAEGVKAGFLVADPIGYTVGNGCPRGPQPRDPRARRLSPPASDARARAGLHKRSRCVSARAAQRRCPGAATRARRDLTPLPAMLRCCRRT
jgi:hypothetical protein